MNRRRIPAAAVFLFALGAFHVSACVEDAVDTTTNEGAFLPDAPPAAAGHDEAARSTALALTAPKLRVVASNLTSGPRGQSYQDPGIRILKGLAPDVALLQEFNHAANEPADIRSFVDQAFGAEYTFVREKSNQIPNGIVSRYPIVESGTWKDPEVQNRSFVWARIDVPGPVDLWAVSVHLLSTGNGYRQREANALVRQLKTLPSSDYVVVGGDLNTQKRGENCVRTLGTFLEADGPYPTDQHGNDDTNGPRSKPYDWVLGNPAIHGRSIPVSLGSDTFPSGLVFDTRVHAPLTAAAPALKADSAALNMQHMAVVRDFELDADEP